MPASLFEKAGSEQARDDAQDCSDAERTTDAESNHEQSCESLKPLRLPVDGTLQFRTRNNVRDRGSIACGSASSSSAAPHTPLQKSWLRNVAVMVVNVQRFQDFLPGMNEGAVKVAFSQYISIIHEVASQGRGNIDCILGDQAFITFNTHIPCAEPAGAAVAAALDIRRLLCPFARDRLRFQIGISCGPVLASSIGYSKFRTMVTLGHPMKISSMVSQMSDFESGTVLVDTSVEEKMKYMYDLRPVELVHFPQLKPLPWNTHSTDRIFLVEGKRVMDEDEWLYQVDKMASPNDWHWAFDQVASAQTAQEGRSFLEQFLQVHPHDAVALRLKAHLAMWIPGIGLPLWERAEHDR
eukprot:GGOE01010456.1.p1 GENE.GGOE01010456.1~~GGOE01010456.1.p1  ORF type:complete len:405 (-),score=101.87 GGOE01010456.1:785-1843(-)